MEDLSDPVVIGVVVAPHGVRGTLRVRALGPGRHLREGTEPVVAGMRRRISAARQTPKGFLLDLEGVERSRCKAPWGRTALARPRGARRARRVLRGRPGRPCGREDAGEVVGTVADTFETAAHEILVVREVKEEQDLYLPFTLEHVPQVDLESGQIVVRHRKARR